MVSKIELYREVLEIEPNSKVFFPLARLLAEQGEHDEAAAVLARGIGFHPDHLEAKFLLIELLTGLGRAGEAGAVFADVGKMLSRYPSVWLLWSREAAARSKDPSLAMLFLANYFQNQTLTWAEVMERGLKSLRRDGTEAALTPEPVEPAAEAASCLAEAVVPVGRLDAAAPQLRGAKEVMELAGLLEGPGENVEKVKTRAGKGREAAVRTKTMAALLAEQGDTAGALDIYDELLKTASSGAEREEIQASIAALVPGKAPASPPAADTPAAPSASETQTPETAAKPKGATKLVSLLEALAGRLDARAGA